MPDMTLSVVISRTLLSLAPLELNDHLVSYLAGPTTPGPITWDRQQVTSPYVEGDYTVSRRRSNVMENIVLEVLGADDATMATNLGTIISAFKQDNFTLTISVNGTVYTWACESADYQVIWDGPRVVSKQVQLQLQVPRNPIPTAGPF